MINNNLSIPVKLPGLQGASSSCVPGGQGARREVVVLPGAQHVPGHVTGHGGHVSGHGGQNGEGGHGGHGGHYGEGHRHSAFKFHCSVKVKVISLSSCRYLCIEISQGEDLEDDKNGHYTAHRAVVRSVSSY